MTEKQNNPAEEDRVERIVRFFKSLRVKKPSCDTPDDEGRGKTEAEYQKEQARWLAEVRKKREKDDQ
jgi:hypothetical protein